MFLLFFVTKYCHYYCFSQQNFLLFFIELFESFGKTILLYYLVKDYTVIETNIDSTISTSFGLRRWANEIRLEKQPGHRSGNS